MTEGRTPWDDERDLARLEKALAHDPDRQPPAERVAAVRAEAVRLRAGATDARAPRHHGPARRSLLLGGIAASAGVVAGYAGGLLVDDPPDGPPTEAVALDGVPDGVTADARLINHTWGTELLLDVRGLPPERTYDVVYLDRGGRPTRAGSFRSVADVLMVCRFNAASLRADVGAIEVRRSAEVVMSARLA